jgi:hypothetical protein
MSNRILTLAVLAGSVVGLGAITVAAADTALPWSVLGGGGGTATSASYSLGGTSGQNVVGAAQSANFALGAGYWYGITDADSDGILDDADLDDDSDGYADVAEAGTPLCGNATNDDNADDAVADDGCPGGPAAVGIFSEGQARIGTNRGYPCGNPGWPSDIQSTGLSANKLDIQDVVSFTSPVRHLDKSPPNPLYSTRWDLSPGPAPFANWINIADITTLLFATTGNPAMFNGTRAFNKTCPMPP